MSKGKTGLIVLTVLAAMFFLFVALLYGSSTKRQGAIDRRDALDDKLEVVLDTDITIYWIGEPPAELNVLFPVIQIVSSESANEETLPVKGPAFHTIEYNEDGQIVSEDIPKDYPRYMIIVISGTPNLSDRGKEALLDAISQNGVPVLAIGDAASETLCDVLCYTRVHKGEGSSLYYCLGAGYKENPISEGAVKSGGMELAEAIPDLISTAMTDYKPQE